jgi:hypothetical protein
MTERGIDDKGPDLHILLGKLSSLGIELLLHLIDAKFWNL